MMKGGQFSTGNKMTSALVDKVGRTAPGDRKEAVASWMACWLRNDTCEPGPFRSLAATERETQ